MDDYQVASHGPDNAKLGTLYMGGLIGLLVLALAIGTASGS